MVVFGEPHYNPKIFVSGLFFKVFRS